MVDVYKVSLYNLSSCRGERKSTTEKFNFDIESVSLGEIFWIVPTGGSHGVELWAASTTDGGLGYSRLKQLLSF